MVKFWYIIFSVYILFLSTIHCSDENSYSESDTQTSVMTASESGDHCPDETACSPFCVCSCAGCQGFNIETTPLFVTKLDQAIDSNVIPYESDFISQFVANIWQPPKI